MTTGVLLMALGSPDSPDEMGAYLGRIMKRGAPSPELVRELQERYATFGGRSPLTDITNAQAAALRKRLGLPVRVGMRCWKPFIEDVIPEMESEGVDRIVGVAMAPHYSRVSVGAYHAAARAAAKRAELALVDCWHAEPKLLDAWAERIRGAGTDDPILFTAHTVPVEAAEPYRLQVRETIDGILERVGEREWDLAWQSRPKVPGRWLGPDVDEVLSAKKWKSVLAVPVGFVTDHAEVLYDIDRLCRGTAERIGMGFRRTEMLNDSTLLIEALEQVVRRAL